MHTHNNTHYNTMTTLRQDLDNAIEAIQQCREACWKYDSFIESGKGGLDPEEADRLFLVAEIAMQKETAMRDRLSPFHQRFYRLALS